MDNKGQLEISVFLLMIGIVIIILALALAGPLRTTIDDVRLNASNGLDCSNTSISKYTKATCVVTDLTIFQFVVGIIVLGGGVIAAKRFL